MLQKFVYKRLNFFLKFRLPRLVRNSIFVKYEKNLSVSHNIEDEQRDTLTTITLVPLLLSEEQQPPYFHIETEHKYYLFMLC